MRETYLIILALACVAAPACGSTAPAPTPAVQPAGDPGTGRPAETPERGREEEAAATAPAREHDRITHADNEEDCRRCGGTWGPRGIIGIPGCVCPTADGGKPCRTSTECEHRCELPWEEAVAAGRIRCRPDGGCEGGGELPEGRCAETFDIFGCRAWIVEEQTDEGPWLAVRAVCVD